MDKHRISMQIYDVNMCMFVMVSLFVGRYLKGSRYRIQSTPHKQKFPGDRSSIQSYHHTDQSTLLPPPPPRIMFPHFQNQVDTLNCDIEKFIVEVLKFVSKLRKYSLPTTLVTSMP